MNYRNRRFGYTLIELLTVIVVIALLAAMLLPALNKTRAKGRAVYCINNLRQWGTGFLLYAADNQSWLPCEGGLSSTTLLDCPWAWYNAVPPMLGMKPYKDTPGQGTSIQDFKELHIWVCPEKIRLRPKSASGKNSVFYAMNSLLNGVGTGSTNSVRLLRFSTPAETVLLFDVYEHDVLGAPVDASASPYRGLHFGGCHFLFADGHVEHFPDRAFWDGSAGVTNWPGLRWTL